MHRLEIALLGPPRIILDGKEVVTDRHKAIGLLAYLATEAKTHRREVLATLLWPDYPRASTFSYLRRTLWELNQMLGKGWIESDRESVTLLHPPGLVVDVETFQHKLASGVIDVEALNEAVNLYRGDFLQDLVIADTAPFEEWQLGQREFYRSELARCLGRLVTALEQKSSYELALAHAQRWLSLDNLNENAYRAIMRQMAGMGDRSGVVRVFQTCTQTLKNELGVAPQKETEDLYNTILRGEPLESQPKKAVPVSSPGKVPGNLPSPATPFIGRKEEIEEIRELVLNQDIHLITLTGVGGTGKTRLSIQVAREILQFFPDCVWFIPLATVQSLQGLILAIAEGLSYSFYKGEEAPRQQLMDYLREKHLLLVLDNFEQLVNSGSELVGEIVEKAPGVKLLVTSRERLTLQAEQVYQVPGMRIPDQQITAGWDDPTDQAKAYSGIQLLLDRARRVRPNYQLTKENLNAVMQICQLVEGSPLGIELAAVWLEVLPANEIVQEITQNLDFLESTSSDLPIRQRSMRAVFDTSWKLLEPQEQQTFRRLSVFKGSFSRQAAQEVSGATIRALLSLANKSWLQQGDTGRYQLHEVLRQYGVERLRSDQDEWQETKDRHAEYFSSFLQIQQQALQTGDQVQALEALKAELESNIPEAWNWLVTQARIDMLIDKMLPGLFHYWLIRSRSSGSIEMLKLAREAVPASNGRNTLVQQAILETVELNFEMSFLDELDQIKQRLEELCERVLASNLEAEMGFWYSLLISTYGFSVNYERGAQRYAAIMERIDQINNPWDLAYTYLLASQFTDIEKHEIRKKYLADALALFKKIGVIHEQGITLQLLGQLFAIELDFKQAIHYTQNAQRYLEQVGDLWGADQNWIHLAEYYIYLGEINKAFHAFEATRQYNIKMGNRRILGIDLSWESLAASRYGSLDNALKLRQWSLEVAVEAGNQSEIAWHTWELGEIYRLMKDIEHARRYYEEALPQFEKLKDSLGLGFYHRGNGDIAMMLGNWEEARNEFELALEYHQGEQRNFRFWGVIYYHARLGSILLNIDKQSEAKEHLKTSFTYSNSWPYPDLKALPLIGMANLLVATGCPTQAIEIAACVASRPTTWNEVKGHARAILETASRALTIEKARYAQERGEGYDIDQLIRLYLESPHLE